VGALKLVHYINPICIVIVSGSFLNQYIHGLAAHGVHYLHRPGPTLQDAGFFILPALGQDKAFFSETVFVTIFGSFILVSFL
jgi:hypothetical protein